ncbi:MAG: histidine kinase [Chitinophagales bacterium]
MNSRTRQILTHILGGIAFLSVPVLFSPDFDTALDMLHVRGFQQDFLRYFILLLFFYFNFYVLVPKLLIPRRYVLFVVIELVCFAAIILLVETAFPMPDMDAMPMPPPHRHGAFDLFRLNHHLFQFLVVVLFSIMLKMTSRLRKVERERVSAELSYLKAQINPHFLFNTLNGIYSLAIENNELTAPTIVKLSGMMRYVMTEAGKDFVPLEKEINYLSDYVELQRMRAGDSVNVSYNVSGNATGKRIAPLLLITFIENAFKYGVNAEEDSVIKVQIDIHGSQIHLVVFNNKVKVRKPIDGGGLGVENTKARLELMYPGRHVLTISDNPRDFLVSLIIKL